MLNVTPETHSALAEACDWLAGYLAAGPQPIRRVQRDAFAAGLSLTTLRRAKWLMAVRSIELPDRGGWLWSAEPGEAPPGGSATA
jgi:hypothetical protein